MKKILLPLLLLCSVAFVRCNKDDDQVVTPETPQLLLVKETFSSGLVRTYDYDSRNRLTKVSYDYSGNASFNYSATLMYNTANQLSEMNYSYASGEKDRLMYSYEGNGKIEKIEHFITNGGPESHEYDELFSYAAGAINVDRYHVAEDTVTPQWKVNIGSDNNTSEIQYYNINTGALGQVTVYHSYDNKKNVGLLLPAAYDKFNDANNPLSATTTVNGSAIDYTYQYEYTKEGYPSKVVNTNTTTTDTFTTVYEYEQR